LRRIRRDRGYVPQEEVERESHILEAKKEDSVGVKSIMVGLLQGEGKGGVIERGGESGKLSKGNVRGGGEVVYS